LKPFVHILPQSRRSRAPVVRQVGKRTSPGHVTPVRFNDMGSHSHEPYVITTVRYGIFDKGTFRATEILLASSSRGIRSPLAHLVTVEYENPRPLSKLRLLLTISRNLTCFLLLIIALMDKSLQK
jgi:hypothetical protein